MDNLTIDGNNIRVSGFLDGPAASQLAEAIGEGMFYVVDFTEVSGINFAGLRTLLRCRQSGRKFFITNADPEIAEKFEDTGVSSFINICRKPRPLDLSKYQEFGASYLSKAFNSADGDAMIKVYGSNVPKWLVAQEKAVARAVTLFGLQTPLVGTLYEDGDSTALDFERIQGKRSFSRIIFEEPERLEEIARRFARMGKQLHTTQCDTNLFQDRRLYYRRAIMVNKDITEEERGKALAFLDSIPEATTCLHGDMQLSNVINNGVEDMWIDLGDFGYGYYMIDMGMWYFLSIWNDESMMVNLFHLTKPQMAKIFDFYIDEYFGADTPEKKAEIVAEIQKYAALHMLYLGTSMGFIPGMLEFVREKILN